jgi:hypothetical protein
MSKEVVGFSNSPEKGSMIASVGSPAELLPALKRGSRAAMVEIHTKHDFGLFADALTGLYKFVSFSFVRDATDSERIAERFAVLKKDFQSTLLQSPKPLQEYKQIMESFDLITDDLTRLLAHFPNYVPAASTIASNYEPHKSQSWHQDPCDEASTPEGTLRLVRVYTGAPTQYARSQKGEGAKSLNGAGVSVHRIGPNGAWHKSPQYDSESNRVVVTLYLIPKK